MVMACVFAFCIKNVFNLDGSQNTDWLKFGTFQSYHQTTELLVKIAYVFFWLKVVLNYFTVKGFRIYDISSLIFVPSNCIDSIYTDLDDLVPWHTFDKG